MVSYKKHLDIEIFEGEISRHQYPWHFHNCYTLIIVEKGSINYEFQDESIHVGEAETLLIEPYKIHRNTILQPTAYRAFFLPHEYFERIEQSKLVTRKVNHPNVIDLFNKIEIKFNKRELKEMVFKFSELMNHLQIEQPHESHTGVNIPIIDYDLTIKELAEKANLSKFHFQRKFKKNFGLTVGQLKQQEKTIKAKTLLEKGKQSTDVAYELGYFDQSHFLKYFKKMWAITPKKFK